MRHRLTYLHEGDAVRAVSSSGITLDPEGDYIQEQRTTLEIPDEYSHIKDLRIQISTDDRPSYPFSYESRPGLHVYAVPQGLSVADEKETFYSQLEQLLRHLLGIEISADAFILAYNSFYYHSSSAEFVEVFPGIELPENWSKIDYFRSNGEVSLKSLSLKPYTEVSNPKHRTEIGVFSIASQSEPEDLILTGGRLILGDDAEKNDKLTKTMFHIKPRHRKSEARVSSKMVANGLHPVLVVEAHMQAPNDSDIVNCQAYVHMTLEKSVFLDPYQIPEQLSLVANYGPKNLELPEYSVPQWGNELLFASKEGLSELSFNMTLHSRYQLPQKEPATRVIIDKPVVFYACDVVDDATLLKQSPFDNFRYLGGTFERFFTENSVFFQAPDAGKLSTVIPNATADASWPNSVTFAALVIGCLLVFNGLLGRFKSVRAKHEKKTQ